MTRPTPGSRRRRGSRSTRSRASARSIEPPSLDRRVGDDSDSATLGELRPSDGPAPDEAVQELDIRARLERAVKLLPEAEQKVIAARFGAGGELLAPGERIERKLGVTARRPASSRPARCSAWPRWATCRTCARPRRTARPEPD